MSLVGGDGHVRLFRHGDSSLSASVGGHRALMTSAPDSTALDLGLGLRSRLSRRLEIYGGAAFSWETIDGLTGSDFTRFHLVPGVRFGIAERLDLLSRQGSGSTTTAPTTSPPGSPSTCRRRPRRAAGGTRTGRRLPAAKATAALTHDGIRGRRERSRDAGHEPFLRPHFRGQTVSVQIEDWARSDERVPLRDVPGRRPIG